MVSDTAFILLTKVQSPTHKGVYLHTDLLELLVKPLEEVFIFGKLLVDILVCITLSVIESLDTNLVLTLLRIAVTQLIFFSSINCLVMKWNRVNDFSFREIQLTTFATLSKQNSVLSKKLMGRPVDTVALTHYHH